MGKEGVMSERTSRIWVCVICFRSGVKEKSLCYDLSGQEEAAVYQYVTGFQVRRNRETDRKLKTRPDSVSNWQPTCD